MGHSNRVELVTVKTLWGWRKSEEFPELMEAWDYYSTDENPDGWREACASWGDDLYAHRYIDLEMDADRITGAFQAPTVEVEVK